jgi:hypothetical protein
MSCLATPSHSNSSTFAMRASPLRHFLSLCLPIIAMILLADQARAAASLSLGSGDPNFGNVQTGTTVSRTLFIANTGDAPATITSEPAITSGGSRFTVSGTIGTIPAGESRSFTVSYAPTNNGPDSGAVSLASTGAVGSPLSISLTGTGINPEIAIKQGSSNINTGGSATAPNVTLNGLPNTASSSTVFTIENTGAGPLSLTGTPLVSITGVNAADFAITSMPASSVAEGSSTTFTVSFTPSARLARTATLTIANNDPDDGESSFTINLTGRGLAPEIEVEDSAEVAIASGGTSTFGNVVVGSTERETFTIINSGEAALNLTAAPMITLDGVNSSDFVVSQMPSSSSLGPSGGFTTFVVQFTPSAAGVRSAAIHIGNNDLDGGENPYTINLSGVGTLPPTGTDGFGYKYSQITANAIVLRETDADVSSASTLLTANDATQVINLGFSFSFYENSYTSLSASTNGLLVFDGASNSWTPPLSLPNNALPDNIIAPLWMDMIKKSDNSSRILYATRGSAPNRVFILEYRNMAQFGNDAANLSFQVLLYEGSNAIEYRYTSISGVIPGSTVCIGIEDSKHVNGISLGVPTELPTALKFSRPVIVKVESEYFKPGESTPTSPAGTLATGLKPEVGETKADYGSNKRFEAPEYIYLNKDFSLLNGAGTDTGTPNDPLFAWYRLANAGYAINGQTVQGAKTFVDVTLTSDMTFVWRWELEFAVNIKFTGVGTPVPERGRHWFRANSPLTASVDTLVDTENTGVRLKTTGYQVTNYPVTGPLPAPTRVMFADHRELSVGTRSSTKALTITGPIELEWLVSAQARYRFSATSNVVGLAGTLFDGLPFIRVYNGAVATTTYGSNNTTDVWINMGIDRPTKVEVGAFYRTADDSYTLGDFVSAPGGDLAPVGTDISNLNDMTVPENTPLTGSRTARVYTLSWGMTSAPQPTEVRWIYQPTVFRAEVPLGMPFDPALTVPPLVRSVAPAVTRELSDSGPQTSSFTPVGDLPLGRTSAGAPLRWDKVDLKLYPVHPMTNRLSWPDKNDASRSYQIEIVSGYPGQQVNLTSERENADGSRQGTAPTWVTTTTLDTLAVTNPGVAFPGATGNAHYNHLYHTQQDKRPPTKLDPDSTDEWKFQDVAYTDPAVEGTAAVSEPGVPFTASSNGRSVLVYSYRANPDEVADGNLNQEKLAVRVVRSKAILDSEQVMPTSSKLVVGRRSLLLGSGSAGRGASGLVSTNGSSSTVDLGPNFVLDFWLNLRGYRDNPVELSGVATTSGSTTVSCNSTTSLVAGMAISGSTLESGTTVASVVNNTTFEISQPANATASEQTFSASGKPVTILSTPNDRLKVTLNPEGPTITVSYFGASVTKEYPLAGASWRHHVIHVFANQVANGPEATVLDYYLDGVRDETGFVTTTLKGTADTASFQVNPTVDGNSLRLGLNADPANELQLDQLRLFANLPLNSVTPSPVDPWLSSANVHELRVTRRLDSGLRALRPQIWLNFERENQLVSNQSVSSSFANSGTGSNIALGAVGTEDQSLVRTDLQEVATRLESTLDDAGFAGSGYILNAVSNYNATLYNRAAEVGQWGNIYPVNDNQLFVSANRRLEVAYYENPNRFDRYSHPKVAWPYEVALYNQVTYPTFGPHRSKAIYIASRLGSESVDSQGRVQEVFSLDRYSDLSIYHQGNANVAGYNPNEEHALVAPSYRAALKVKNLGEDIDNNPPMAAFALQNQLNNRSGYTSAPWVLVQYANLSSGETEMAAYQVFETRSGSIAFPRPADAVVNTTAGLSYSAAATPEERFLTLDRGRAYNFSYSFRYPVYAGDLLIAPYPLNLVIGNATMRDARGASVQINGVNQRSLWRDVNGNAWVVSGNGCFFHQFFYPQRADFHLPGIAVGTPVAWLPALVGGSRTFTGTGSSLEPVKVVYDTLWRSDYPKLKRGETLTYQGGEYFNENPGSSGLPALVAMKAAEIIYDSATPSMVLGTTTGGGVFDYTGASARIIRPLDRREQALSVAQMNAAGLRPAERNKVFVVAERWYFKDLPGSLQRRFYYNSLEERLVLRGYLNNKDSGDKDLTSGPDPLNILEPNILTPDEYSKIRALASSSGWTNAVDALYVQVQSPEGATGSNTAASQPVKNLQGLRSRPGSWPTELTTFWNTSITSPVSSPSPVLVPLNSFGVGAALVPNASLLTASPTGSLYITIAENNRSELNGAAVSLHIIEIVPERYRGAIKVIEGSDAFSEKITLQHNGDFGANTADLYYEWWIRDAASLDEVAGEVLTDGTLKGVDSAGNTLWQEYLPKERLDNAGLNMADKHLGLHSIVLEGRPDVVLADKLVLMRYRHRNETNWKLVPFEVPNRTAAWAYGDPAPFQWAGAANSPQLQADGSKRFVPQLVMGWVKRVLDRINPYEARYTDFFGNESPATYSSQIQIAGAPYAGNVALNSDKSVIENTGLIELYSTVLDRAKSLSIDNSSNGAASAGIKQALLLAATRLSTLYELLGSEAYSDAQDNTINAGADNSLLGVASYTHAFQNMEADLMHEELALLRGTDFLKSYPVYNRLFWNYAKGLGEPAYNVNYNIHDANTDGFINEDDARKLYPQGHGDAWGHYLSAIDMHYTLLQHPGFSWAARSELYSLMQNVLEVDYLDEKTFAKLAAAKARAGRDIVRGTYRLNYTRDPDGQWQGYTDAADPARAWGVSEWAHRAGQAAWFDHAVANAILPEQAAGNNPENLDALERSAAADEIGQLAAGLHEIQVAMDEANGGVNPLGLDSDAITFDIELQFYDNSSGNDRRSHFEQVVDRAQEAGANAMTALQFATQADNKLRAIGEDTDALIQQALSQDLDYRNRLIEIFGRPYTGTIGFGKVYPEGYEGPDSVLYAYLDKVTIAQIVPPMQAGNDSGVSYLTLSGKISGAEVMNQGEMVRLYSKMNNNGKARAFESLINANSLYRFGSQLDNLQVPYVTASRYGFQAESSWGTRTSYGSLQASLQEMLASEIELDSSISNYIAFLRQLEAKVNRLRAELELNAQKEGNKDVIVGVRASFNSIIATIDVALRVANLITGPIKITAGAIRESLPTSIGFSNDFTSIARGVMAGIQGAANASYSVAEQVAEIAKTVLNLVRDEIIARKERDNEQLDTIRELEGLLEDLAGHIGNERPLRNAIGSAIHSMEAHRQSFITAQATGFRLLREREAFNKILAAKVQKNRYQDMLLRLSRNESLGKYQSAFNNAARYVWLAARAYDYETSLDEGHPGAPGSLLDRIVRERQLGQWVDGQPLMGNGGLAEILAQLKANFRVLKGQLGLSNPQGASEQISLRTELLRIMNYDQEVYDAFDTPAAQRTAAQLALVAANPDAPASRARWRDALKARLVPDLNQLPEFVTHCRPLGSGAQPGLVLRFPTSIEAGRNFFGLQLAPGDHGFSLANFATKIQTLGVQLENYGPAGLAATPRAYLVPVGNDYMRTSTNALPVVRAWSVVERRLPVPFTINSNNLSSPGFIPTLDGTDGTFGATRRHGDFRLYYDGDEEQTLTANVRLIGRSVWNSEWMLIIPGVNLHHDAESGLDAFTESVSDIKLHILTYSHSGQ